MYTWSTGTRMAINEPKKIRLIIARLRVTKMRSPHTANTVIINTESSVNKKMKTDRETHLRINGQFRI